MSSQSPIIALRRWLESQPEDARHELALHVAYPLFDVPSLTLANKQQCVQLVLEWLDDTIARNLQLGRILSFRACMDYLMSSRDTPAKWDELDERTKQIVGDLPPENAATGDFLLTVMPARREQWVQLAADWYRLRDGIFEGRHLDAWAFKG